MKKKIIISALALTIGAGLAGSITGTAAWYQYSTKVNGAYIGVAGGSAGNLNMRIRKDGQAANEDWSTFISKEELMTHAQSNGYGTNILPVTPGALDKNDDLTLGTDGNPVMYSNPVPGRAEYNTWNKASKASYIVIPLQLRYVERDGVKENGVDEKNIAKEVYLSDLVLQQPTADAASHNDLSEALRFHISTYDSNAANPTKKSRLVSKKGGKTVVHGKLDLDGDGYNDKARPGSDDKYGFNSNYSNAQEISYGGDTGDQVSYTSEVLTAPKTGATYYDADNALAGDADVYSLVAQSRTGDYADDLDDHYLDYVTGNSKTIGSTFDGNEKFLNVDITIWVEGWQKFKAIEDEEGYSSIWNNKYLDAGFQVGFEFAINSIEELNP